MRSHFIKYDHAIIKEVIRDYSLHSRYKMTIKCDRFFNFILPIKCDRLNAGVYSLHYWVRSVTPGTFEWPSAEVYLQYAPEEFGRSASSSLEIVSEN